MIQVITRGPTHIKVTLLSCSSKMRSAACPCTHAVDCFSHAGYRSLFAPTSTAFTHSSQSEDRVPPAPIRVPKRPKAGSTLTDIYTNAISQHRSEGSLIRLWLLGHFDFEVSRQGWGCTKNKRIAYSPHTENNSVGYYMKKGTFYEPL